MKASYNTEIQDHTVSPKVTVSEGPPVHISGGLELDLDKLKYLLNNTDQQPTDAMVTGLAAELSRGGNSLSGHYKKPLDGGEDIYGGKLSLGNEDLNFGASYNKVGDQEFKKAKIAGKPMDDLELAAMMSESPYGSDKGLALSYLLNGGQLTAGASRDDRGNDNYNVSFNKSF